MEWRHLVINGCISTLLLCVVFCIGIRVVSPRVVCWTIACTLHLFSLASLFWFSILLL